jgi:hypothetical protein
MRTYEYWRHRKTREIWAVELKDGVVVGCAGPLHPGDVGPDFLPGYDYTPEGAVVLEAARDAFELLDEAALLLLGG